MISGREPLGSVFWCTVFTFLTCMARLPNKKDTGGDLVRKAVDTLAIVPTKQRIYPLARKLYNVLLFLSQRQGMEREIYTAALSEIVSHARFSSKDVEIVKNHLRNMNATQVEWQSPTRGEGSRWEISNLIAHATIIEQGSGRPTKIEWSFAPNIKRELLDPSRFAQISLIFQSALRTYASLALFEICLRYVNNPGGLTARNPWEWWRPVLTGTPEADADTYLEYKYLKRDVINPAVSEINRITDIDVELVEFRAGRKIMDLQFRVSKKKQGSLPLQHQPEFDLRIVGEALKLGVPQMAAETLLTRHGKDAMNAGLKVLAERIQKTGPGGIARPDQYLSAILRRIGKPEASKPRANEATTITRQQLIARYRSARLQEARELFEEIRDQERAEVLARFEVSVLEHAPQPVRRDWQRLGLRGNLARVTFEAWFAEQTWGSGWDNPTPEDLLALVAPT